MIPVRDSLNDLNLPACKSQLNFLRNTFNLSRFRKIKLKKISFVILRFCSFYSENVAHEFRDCYFTRNCQKLFDSVVSNTAHKLHHLLLTKNISRYNFRNQRILFCPKCALIVTRTHLFHPCPIGRTLIRSFFSNHFIIL